MSKPIDDAVKAMQPYEGKLESQVCSWGGFGTQGGEIKHHSAMCLGVLNYNNYQKYKTLWHFHRPKTEKTVSVAWLKALLNKRTSPYRQLIKAQPLQKFSDVYKHGVVLTELEFPANYVVNFLTAFRLTQEYPWMANLWYRLTKDGVSFGTAVCVVGQMMSYNEKNNTVAVSVGDRGHYAFSWGAGDWGYPKRINDATPIAEKMSKHMFSKNTTYTPCNIIWGSGNSKCSEKLRKFLKNFEKKSSRGRFGNPHEVEEQAATYDGVLAFCKLVDKGDKFD